MARVSIVPLIDCSGTMGSFGYIEPAKTDAATFVGDMKVNDQVGVVAFSTQSRIVFPLTTIDSDRVQQNAMDAIARIGVINMTNIKEAIAQGHGMLVHASNTRRAMILLSDGLWNEGGDPLPTLPTDIPIHTIALGDHGELPFLQTVAKRTFGKYHYSPDSIDLMEMYLEIAGEAGVATVSRIEKQRVARYRSEGFPMNVPEGTDKIDLSVSWVNPSIEYTEGTPGRNQVAILLRDPDNNKYPVSPTFIGRGFAIFRLTNPRPGTWSVYTWCGDIGSQDFRGTAGVLEPESSLALKLDVLGDAEAGPAVELYAELNANGAAVEELAVHASLESPILSHQDLLDRHATALDGIRARSEWIEAGMTEERAKLIALRESLLPNVDIFARQLVPLDVRLDSSGKASIKLTPAKPGNHTVRLDVHGRMAGSQARFSRTRRASFITT